jgi:cellulose biosynthesis protein BcsQ
VSVPVLAFFNNKGGVGKTTLVYHLAWMLASLGRRVLACDFDPQANLTAAFLDEEELAELFDQPPEAGATVSACLQPLTQVGDLRSPNLREVKSRLFLLPGDLALSGIEDELASEWPKALGSASLYRPFRLLASLWILAQLGASQAEADLVLIDVGPNLGALNRSALIAADHVVVPLAADLFSLQGLRNFGPTLQRWRKEWGKRLQNWEQPDFDLPRGSMGPIGYTVQQHSVRLGRPVKAYDRWVNRIPGEYRRSVLDEAEPDDDLRPAQDPHCLATLKHFRSLVLLAQEARKPIFELTVADGAIGAHAVAVQQAQKGFQDLAEAILSRVAAPGPPVSPRRRLRLRLR